MKGLNAAINFFYLNYIMFLPHLLLSDTSTSTFQQFFVRGNIRKHKRKRMISKEKADEEEDGDKTNHQEEIQVNLR